MAATTRTSTTSRPPRKGWAVKFRTSRPPRLYVQVWARAGATRATVKLGTAGARALGAADLLKLAAALRAAARKVQQ
jgi:hypothetical protein